MPASLRGLQPQVRAAAQWAIDVATRYNVPVTVTSTVRPWEEQARLRARWERAGRPAQCVQTRTGVVCPANRPGDSAHEWGMAWDSDVPPYARRWWIVVRRAAGFQVFDHDDVHAEVPNWRRYVRTLS